MPDLQYSFRTTLWRWSANASWVFLSVPAAASDEIDDRYGSTTGGFGAIKVRVRLGTSAWRTSIFPSKAHGGYVLPVRKAVRTAEGVDVDDEVTVLLDIVERADQ